MLGCILCFIEHLVFTLVVVIVGQAWYNEGITGVLEIVVKAIRQIPGVEGILQQILSKEVKNFTSQTKSTGVAKRVTIPAEGIPHKELIDEMEKIKGGDQNPEEGKLFAYVYTSEDDTFDTQTEAYDKFCEKTGLNPDHEALVRQFHHAFMHENALNPMVFPSLRRFENETISMTAAMLNGDEKVVGSLTSGGTESVLMAMKAYRDMARKVWPHIKNPEMVAPITIHPCHEKAAHYFGFTIKHVKVGADFKPDLQEYEEAIGPNTIALLASAPQYAHGIVDPIEQISDIAIKRGLPMHVDSCFGGFMLPWVEKLGYKVPRWDFRVPGVTSISADIHKYGFGAKGASVVVYRNEEIRKYQIFAYSRWPGGLFGSPSMAGTRPGGNIAAAWVALKAMGVDGYMKVAKRLMDCTEKLKEGVTKIPGLCIMGKPHMTAFAIGSSDPQLNIMALADAMEERGWKIERNQLPDSLHCTIMPHHVAVADELLKSLEECAGQVKGNKALGKKGTAAMYGMVASIPDKAIIDDFIVQFFSEVYKA